MFLKYLKPVGGIKSTMNFNETYWNLGIGVEAPTCPGISIEDAGRVGDPTSIARPCKNPAGVRSLVPTEANESASKRNFLIIKVFCQNLKFLNSATH